MERFLEIVNTAIEKGATDIHLKEGMVPLYRIKRNLIKNNDIEPLSRYELERLLEVLTAEKPELLDRFEQTKRLDVPLEVNDEIRLRVNVSTASGVPTFSIRIIRTVNIQLNPCFC